MREVQRSMSNEIDERIDRLEQQVNALRIYLASAIAIGVLAICCLVIPLWWTFGSWLSVWIAVVFVACGILEMWLLDSMKYYRRRDA
jgi:hypothetical protein